MKFIKRLFVNLLTVAAVIVVLALLGTAFSDRVNPVSHPSIGCLGMALPLFIGLNILSLLLILSFCWKRAWIPVAGFILAYVPIRTFIPLNISREAPEGCIKLVTYNVCAYGGNWKYEQGLDTVVSYLMAQNADIICIQEDRSEKFKVVDRWSQLYPYNDTVHISKAMKLNLINVIGIHTRYPILKRERIQYKSNSNGSAAYYLQVGNDTVIVINNHLESTHLTKDDRELYEEMMAGHTDRNAAKDDARQIISKLKVGMAMRAPQVDAVHRYVEEHSQYPIIVCGDFNDTPISYAHYTISKGLKDCFAEAGCGLGLSYNRKWFNLRIDHVFCSPELTPEKCYVDNKMDASDHYPVLCWLKMADKP